MIVVLADNIPPAVRGRMKLYFIEIKTNVFISGVKDSLAKSIADYLLTYCPMESGLIIIESIKKPPYYKITKKGRNLDKIGNISGLPLIFDKISEG